ncbi:MAG: hypothetical protein II014_00795, partial [Bifidobacteriaceae bacterium]|nr:hypothetical protein [Bifidobacteriaceae bacterium]
REKGSISFLRISHFFPHPPALFFDLFSPSFPPRDDTHAGGSGNAIPDFHKEFEIAFISSDLPLETVKRKAL